MDLTPDQIILFTNSAKKTEKHPDIKGQAQCVCPHCNQTADYEVVMWSKVSSKNGSKYLIGKIKQPEENEWTRKKAEYKEQVKKEEEKTVDEKADNLPF